MLTPRLVLLLHTLRHTREQSQKNALMAICTGISAVCSLLVGTVIGFLLHEPRMTYWGTILASFILMPASWFIGISIWDFLRARWLDSKDVLTRLKFLEDEYLRGIHFINQSGLAPEIVEREKEQLLREYFTLRKKLLSAKHNIDDIELTKH